MNEDRTRALVRWLVSIDRPDAVILACPDAIVPAMPAEVVLIRDTHCLVSAGIELPAQVLACGAPTLWVVGCPHAATDVSAVVARWQTVLRDVREGPPALRRRQRRDRSLTFTIGEAPVDRRHLFGFGRAVSAPIDVDADEITRGVEALQVLAREGRASPPPEDAAAGPEPDEAVVPPVGLRLRADGCTACGVCVRACPHGALVLDQGATSVLTHLVDRCRSDLSCVRLCPERALTSLEAYSMVEVAHQPSVVLAEVPTVRCPRCGASHPGTEPTLCPTCAFRKANPFGSQAAPAAKRHGTRP